MLRNKGSAALVFISGNISNCEGRVERRRAQFIRKKNGVLARAVASAFDLLDFGCSFGKWQVFLESPPGGVTFAAPT
jgi:hypothetical protein